MARKLKFEVGQVVWKFDENRRVYARNAAGQTHGAPIYAGHFAPETVLGVEGRSYVIGDKEYPQWAKRYSFAKAETLFCTDAERADRIFVREHGHKIADWVHRLDAATLRRVAEIIGYVVVPSDAAAGKGGES